MRHHGASHHIQFDIPKTAPQVLIAIHNGGVKVVAPKGVHPLLAPIIGAGKFACHLPHEPTDLQPILSINEQMDMVTRQAVVQQGDLESLQLLSHFSTVSVSIPSELQQEFPVMTPVSHVKNSSLNLQAMRSTHRQSITDLLKACITNTDVKIQANAPNQAPSER
jgi:hypothetical protein